ncbi:hypothetical protein ACLH2R_005273, partial [Pseudomonas aeruginosa]|nr:hypothetical protein [Pseudomonas aeruginosa]EKV2963076.1 hypothetical protein [Pseudomonas aeruginosa]EKV3139508.1 hypothetical protein [Pseudomonas aeruginosa]EKW2749250.1 hypothetical protein [Pseudomonas aeruginosa]EKW5508967.1 hypothetical protein [Pseudomonas aeruginosa]
TPIVEMGGSPFRDFLGTAAEHNAALGDFGLDRDAIAGGCRHRNYSGRDCGKSKHGEFWHSFSKGYLNPGLRGEAPFQVLRSMRRIIALAA